MTARNSRSLCSTGSSVAYLQLDGKALQLPKKIAYTGNRYAKDGYTFWVRGNGTVTIKRAGRTSECFSVSTPGR